MSYDTVIIGAGMSGLAAGIRLAHYNQRVCILEQHYAVGGLNSFYRQRGRTLDVGLHALTNYVPKGTNSLSFRKSVRRLPFPMYGFISTTTLNCSFPKSEDTFPNKSMA